jgi:iron complex outermembrane receptor protein
MAGGGRGRWPALALALGFACAIAQGQEADPAEAAQASNELPAIEVVAPAPLPGLGVDLRQIPANVQSIEAARIEKSHPVDASEAIERNLGSVNLNDTQGGPLQADVNFRGFTASPVLGTPQGISVFVDGVRVNEAFGDTVNWDLIPPAAIARITVIPGSNPVFGLNTLGGAMAVSTKSGFEFPGTTFSVSDGSWGRKTVEAASGGHAERLEYFVAARALNDGGWGEHNPSHLRQVFSKLGWQTGSTDVDASLTYADDYAEGNQTIPLSFLGDPRQIYSYPDSQQNRLWFANLQATHALGGRQVLSADLYDRSVRSSIFNSNVNNNYDPAQALAPGNFPGNNALNGIDQNRIGASLQYNGIAEFGGHRNNLTVGAMLDRGTTDFTQFNQDAPVLPDRSTFSSQPIVLGVDLHAVDDNAGVYFTDLFELAHDWSLTLAGRYNHAGEHLQDRLGTALDGDHGYGRFNPAAGLSWSPSPALTAYLSSSEGMRVPTPVELSCANPAAPCSLPNAFSSDPALRPVISRTWEAGARGHVEEDLSWSAAVFRSTLDDDLQFISSGGGATSAGYFQNVGQTRRQGLELGLGGKARRLEWRFDYTLLQATYRSPLVLNSPDNSTAQSLTCPGCSDILVQPGDRMPGIPRHIAKLDLEWSPSARGGVDLNFVAQSSTYPRGDENNQDVRGTVPGYFLANLAGHYAASERLEILVKTDNLFNRQYSSFGTLGANAFHLPGNAFDPNPANWPAAQFRSIGPGRGAWLGLSYRWP